MTDFTKRELEEINNVKKKLYDKLSYTDQSYETIIKRIVELFRNGELNTSWDNISESDIMFIFMSLLASHKDILNYMVDYRILETYLNTAREASSLYRIAASFGFKVPSFRSSSCVASLEGSTPSTVNNFSTFLDSNGTPWTYIDQDYDNSGDDPSFKVLGPGDEITLFQGTTYTIGNLIPKNFDKKTKSHIVSNKSVSVGNTRNEKGCSLLFAVEGSEHIIYFTQVDNIYNYTGIDDYVYELNVDPLGQTYIKLPMNFDITTLLNNKTLVFKYLLTSGSATAEAGEIEIDDNVLVPTNESFYRGKNPVDKKDRSTFKELFRTYYASADTLVTLDDYKNYILNVQKTLQAIDKCLVIDNQHDTRDIDGAASSNLSDLEVAVYVLKEDNELLTVDEKDTLQDLLDTNSVSGISILMNTDGTKTLSSKTIYINTGGAVSSDIKDVIVNYIKTKDIGSTITSSEIVEELKLKGYSNFTDRDIALSEGTDFSDNFSSISLEYYEYPTIESSNIHPSTT